MGSKAQNDRLTIIQWDLPPEVDAVLYHSQKDYLYVNQRFGMVPEPIRGWASQNSQEVAQILFSTRGELRDKRTDNRPF